MVFMLSPSQTCASWDASWPDASCSVAWGLVVGRLMDRRPNPLISSAAAEIARHRRVDILVGGIFVVLKKCDRLHDLAGLAVAALRHPDLHPRLLHGMHGRDAFNGRDLGATDVVHGSDAGAD